MANGTQDFINTFFQVENLKQQRQQQALMEHNSQVERARTLLDMARMAGSQEGREDLIAMGPELENLLGPDLAPTAQTMLEGAVMRGYDRLAEEERGEVERRATIGELTGETATQVAMGGFLESLLGAGDATDEELADLARQFRSQMVGTSPLRLAEESALVQQITPQEFAQAWKIQTGQELSEFEAEQISHWASRLNLDMMDLAQRGALGTAGLQTQLAIAGMQAQGTNAPNPNTLFPILVSMLETAGDSSVSRQERAMAITMFNNAADLLESIDFWPGAEFRLPPDPDDIDKPIGNIRNFLFGAGGAGAGAAVGSLLLKSHPLGRLGAIGVGALGGFGTGVVTGRGAGPTTGFPGGAQQLLEQQSQQQSQRMTAEDLMQLFNELGLDAGDLPALFRELGLPFEGPR